MKKLSDEKAKLNLDVRKLYNQFDDNLERYHEIQFADAVAVTRQKWPLLAELNPIIKRRKSDETD